MQSIENVEKFVNSLANTERIFEKDFGQIEVFVARSREASAFKAASIELAKEYGVNENKILKDCKEIDYYFEN